MDVTKLPEKILKENPEEFPDIVEKAKRIAENVEQKVMPGFYQILIKHIGEYISMKRENTQAGETDRKRSIVKFANEIKKFSEGIRTDFLTVSEDNSPEMVLGICEYGPSNEENINLMEELGIHHGISDIDSWYPRSDKSLQIGSVEMTPFQPTVRGSIITKRITVDDLLEVSISGEFAEELVSNRQDVEDWFETYNAMVFEIPEE